MDKLDGHPPNPQGRRGPTGGQTRIQRRNLIAIAADRRRQVEEGSKLHELWSKLYFGWERCGWSALYRNEHNGTIVGLPDHCDKPLCPYDEQRRVGVLRDRYRARHDKALDGRRLYLAVLTVPNVAPGELAGAFDRLRDAIGKLRRRRWWRDGVAGGLWRLEVTVNLDDGTWHPHANLLFETNEPIRMAEWQPLIQAEWRSVLGESEQQWVWLMPGWDGALPEAVKRQVAQSRSGPIPTAADAASSIAYTVKANKPEWIDPSEPEWVVEYIEGQAGRRSVSSFGAWRGLKAERDPDQDDGEPTVDAPYAAFSDPFVTRQLPVFDPTLPMAGHLPAEWVFAGHGPRWALRNQPPLEEGRREWLVWQADDRTPNPADADDDAPPTYQPRLLSRAGPRHQEDRMPLLSDYRRAKARYNDLNRGELRARPAAGAEFDRYVAEPCPTDAPEGCRRGRCSACGGGVALPRGAVALWSALPIVCAVCAA